MNPHLGDPRSSLVPDNGPEDMAKADPLATQIWRMYAKHREQLPNAARMENLTWRMMSLTLRKQRDEKEDALAKESKNSSIARDFPHRPSDPAVATTANVGSGEETPVIRGRNKTVRPIEASVHKSNAPIRANRPPMSWQRSRSRSLSMMAVSYTHLTLPTKA